MSSIDERTVKMRFDNAGFKKAAAETQTSLAGIDKSVANTGKGRGLLDMAGHMETVKVKAGAMQVAAITAIANIANRAVNAGITMAKSFTLDPIKQGFQEYELKMKSIQTILANTKGENLKSVSAALNELNEYSDKTIYNFANMTENIGKLTTAGIDLETSTAVVKGFHNMVALAGGDATAAAGAMEQFGQGLQAGTIKAMDWMSISNRGLGSQSLQKAFFESARAMGSLTDVPLTTTFEEWAKANGGFKASLEQGWLTTDVATTALSAVTGDVKDVQELMDQGFSRTAAEDMLKLADDAVESATKIRTFSAFIDTTKEALASGWGQIMETIFGDFNESTKLFTSLSETTGKYIKMFFGYISRLVEGFAKLGGRTAVLETIKNLLSPILAILGLVAKAWKLVFGGGDTGRGLSTIAKALQHATRPLRIFSKLISGQITPLEAWERVVTVAKNALRNFLSYVGGSIDLDKMFGSVPSGSKVVDFIKDLAREVREAVDRVKELVDGTGKLKDVFDGFELPDFGGFTGGLGDSESKVKSLAGSITAMRDMPSSMSLGEKSAAVGSTLVGAAKEKTGGMFNPDADISAGRVSDIPAGPDGTSLSYVADEIDKGTEKFESATDKSKNVIGGFLGWLKEFFKGFNFDDLMASFNIAVLLTFVVNLSSLMKTLEGGIQGFSGIMPGFFGVFHHFADALSGFAQAAKREAMAKIILNIAIALAILVASVWVLSRIPQAQLIKAITALAAIAFILKLALDSFAAAVEKMDGKSLQMVGLGFGMIALAIAISILASAMKKMNDVDWSSVLKAAIAIELLTRAMKKLAEMDKEGLLKASFAMIIVAGSLLIFAVAIKQFAKLDFKTFAEGMAYAAAALYIMVTILDTFQSSVGGAIALVIVVGALWLLVGVIERFAKLQFKVFAEGMSYVGIALLVLATTMKGFQSSLLGAAALYVVMYALEALYGVIIMFAGLDWKTFLTGLAMVAIAMVVVGGGLALLSLVAGPIALLAGALALLAFGLTALTLAFALILPILAAGVGAFAAFATGAAIAFAVFLTTLAAEAPLIKKALLDILQVMIDTIVEAVPMVIDGVKRLWAAIKAEFQSDDKKGLMGDSGKSWIEKLRDGIMKKLPAIIDSGMKIIIGFITGIAKRAKELAEKGVDLVVALIRGIGNKAGDLASAAVDLVVKLAKGIGDNLPRLVKAGITLIADYLHALADGIRTGADKIGGGLKDVLSAMKDVGIDIVKGLISGVEEMVEDALGAIGDLAGKMVGKAKDILDIFSPSRVFKSIGKFLVEGLTIGIQSNAANAITAVASMVGGQIAVANEYISGFIQKLDQQAIAASAKAAGLADAAEAASKSADRAAAKADKTKSKKDDRKANKAGKSADRLSDAAEKAAKRAEKAEAKAEKAREAQDRAAEFEKSDLLTKAQMRSEDAQMSMEEAKDHEFNAARNLAEAEALEKQAGAKGVSAKDAKAMRKEAARLRKQAEAQAKLANAAIEQARTFAGNALELQTQAGNEASLMFQQQYDQEAAEDAAEDAFSKLTDAEKAVKRREEAAALQAKADQQLADAKVLAYTDLEAANELAETAMANAQKARDYLDEAASLEEKTAGGTGTSEATTSGRVVNTAITDAAGLIMQRANDRYTAATASAAGSSKVEFNQYNTSPESLNPSEVYRRTHNLLDTAGERILIPAA